MDLEGYTNHLKELINDLHRSHGGNNNGMSCSVCILAVLDRVNLERSVINGKRTLEGEF